MRKSKEKARLKKMTKADAKLKKMTNSKVKKMTKLQLNNIHKRLENGEHLLVADYGNVSKTLVNGNLLDFTNEEGLVVDFDYEDISEANIKKLIDGHLNMALYGNLKKAIYSIWYSEDSKGKKNIQIIGQNDEIILDFESGLKGNLILDNGMDIRNYKGSPALKFLEPNCLEIQKDKLNQKQRLIKDYTDMLSLVNREDKNKARFIHYQSELDRLTKESEEYAI